MDEPAEDVDAQEQVAVGSADLAGFTVLTEAHGHEDAVARRADRSLAYESRYRMPEGAAGVFNASLSAGTRRAIVLREGDDLDETPSRDSSPPLEESFLVVPARHRAFRGQRVTDPPVRLSHVALMSV